MLIEYMVFVYYVKEFPPIYPVVGLFQVYEGYPSLLTSFMPFYVQFPRLSQAYTLQWRGLGETVLISKVSFTPLLQFIGQTRFNEFK